MRKLIIISLLWLSVVLVLGAGCAEPMSVEEEVTQRAQQRHQAMIERDFEKIWHLTSPGHRERVPLMDFVISQNRRPLRWLDATVERLECEDSVCKVVTQVKVRPLGGGAAFHRMEVTQPIEERWILVEDEWWFADTAR